MEEVLATECHNNLRFASNLKTLCVHYDSIISWFLLQLEELRLVPADSEKEIVEMEAKKVEFEAKVKVEEEKMNEIMASLKTETADLQKEKDVSRHICFPLDI